MRFIRIAAGAAFLITAAHADDEWTVTKTVKWSLLDRIAVVLCEAEREDCHSDWRCGPNTDFQTTNCITIGITGDPSRWTLYRDRARKALEAAR